MLICFIYNIGVLTVNIEFMWRDLETGKDSLVFPSVSCRATYILYLPSIHQYCIYAAITFAKKMLFNLILKKENGNPIDTSIVVPVRGVA
jgi:hypothetical protein